MCVCVCVCVCAREIDQSNEQCTTLMQDIQDVFLPDQGPHEGLRPVDDVLDAVDAVDRDPCAIAELACMRGRLWSE